MTEIHNEIFIEDLEVEASVGIYDHEKAAKQTLILSACIHYMDGKTFNQDDIHETLNYEIIINIINNTAQAHHFNLIESLAETIAAKILEIEDTHYVEIEIRKPSVLGSAIKGILGIRIKRGR